MLKADAGRLANRVFHTVAVSSADTKTKGVAIVARCSLPMSIITSWADDMGRLEIARIEFNSRKIAYISACSK